MGSCFESHPHIHNKNYRNGNYNSDRLRSFATEEISVFKAHTWYDEKDNTAHRPRGSLKMLLLGKMHLCMYIYLRDS